MTVRVRIAPSPTGDPHVGTAYIGLLNYCFARHHGGRFILRIEDTDQTRCTRESAEAIFASLKWLGLTYDEGPDVGGGCGPYVQSQRHQAGLYRPAVEQLLQQGEAYRCFCTPAELDAMREAQKAAGSTTIMYDQRCRRLDPAAAAARAAQGEPHVIRMKAPDSGAFTYRDPLRKDPFSKQWAEIDDQVLIKADGWPTYHLAAVVDDHLMAITHVIRAEEWLNSLPKHVWLYERLGWTPPAFVHVGLLRNADRSKISKRKNPTNLLWYRREGYLPQALLNFLAQLGMSHPEGKEVFSLEELVRVFDLDRINVAGPVFDLAKLRHLQGLYLRALDDRALLAEVHRCLDERLAPMLPILRERMVFGGDAIQLSSYFFSDLIEARPELLIPKGWDAPRTREELADLHAALGKAAREDQLAWTVTGLETFIRARIESRGLKAKEFFPLVRAAATGRRESPPLFDVLFHLGRERTLARLQAAIEALK